MPSVAIIMIICRDDRGRELFPVEGLLEVPLLLLGLPGGDTIITALGIGICDGCAVNIGDIIVEVMAPSDGDCAGDRVTVGIIVSHGVLAAE